MHVRVLKISKTYGYITHEIVNKRLDYPFNYRKIPMVIDMKPVHLTPESEQMVRIHAALANPARFRILEILSKNPETIAADIVNELPLSQSTVSQHIGVLMEAGLIYGEDAEGGRRCCRINTNAVRDFTQASVGWAYDLVASAGCRVNGGFDS